VDQFQVEANNKHVYVNIYRADDTECTYRAWSSRSAW